MDMNYKRSWSIEAFFLSLRNNKNKMATLQQLTPHPKWKHLIGKEVVFSIKGVKQLSDTLYFIGENMVGQKVISTETQRAMFYIDSWDDVEIRESCYSQLLKTYEL